MLTAGPLHYEVGANVDATSFGGIAAVHRQLGLPEAIDADLELLKVHQGPGRCWLTDWRNERCRRWRSEHPTGCPL
jgi:hypothetical protein